MIPSLFLAHGSPMLAVEDTEYSRFLEDLARHIQPKAIVVFSAHWESEELTVSSTDDAYDTIYDFGGFPDELYRIQYPAKGSVAVASLLEERFKRKGIPVHKDAARGLDHGSWTLLYRMYPKADIPVVQVSVNPHLSPKEQFEIGEALQGLGAEGILVIGSGVTVHNLRILKWEQETPEPWAVEFDDWLIEKLRKRELETLFDYGKLAPHARLAVPTAEHFVPLFIAMGSAGRDAEAKVIHRSYEFGSLSYLCLEFS